MNNPQGLNYSSGGGFSGFGGGGGVAVGGGSISISGTSHPDDAMIHSYPKFTLEDELREMSTLTMNEIVKVESDLMGVTASFDTMAVGAPKQHYHHYHLQHPHPWAGHYQQQQHQQQHQQQPSDTVREVEEEHLYRLQIELDSIPLIDKVAYVKACSIPARLSSGEESCKYEAMGINDIGRSRHMAYLECCSFDATLAARKIVQYWEERLELFGVARAFLSMTLHGAMKDEVEWMMATSSMMILPQRDGRGRTVIFGDPSRKDMSIYDSRRQVMTMWYLLETVLQDAEARRRGLVVVTSAKYSHGMSMDFKSASWCRRLLGDVFPVPLRSSHFCHPSKVANYVLFPILKFLMGRDMRLRFKSHYGTDSAVLCQLESYGLTRDVLPKELCGAVDLDMKKWVHERLAHEYAAAAATAAATGTVALTPPAAAGTTSTSSASDALNQYYALAGSLSVAEPRYGITQSEQPVPSDLGWRELKFKARRNSQRSDQEARIAEPQFKRRSASSAPSDTAHAAASAGSGQKNATAKKRRTVQSRLYREPKKDLSHLEEVLDASETPKNGKNKVGRRADPRMNRAVRIKLRHPELTPYDALVQGGYDYPRPERGSSAQEIFDADNINLHQRKNQLCRRVRQLRQKQLKQRKKAKAEAAASPV